ncbi:universal stress protein [Pontibacter sp. SGAir0037]|uniref:universal stress protein n=1 Tax=Pontibacter sp. SGAir0037 TaxID=2571030 RepID=UPI0010CD6245|nr:universal stress protein [Pontibacter sp. SGAir0037]QCR22203.1 universal stress protein [Pontibacter sp. SGAir0037]
MCKSKYVKRILVPVQFNKESEELLRYAGNLAETMGAELLLLFTSQTKDLTYTQQNQHIKLLRAFGERILSQEMKFRARGVGFECVVRPGTVSDCIVAVVQDYAADLVLMETCPLHQEEEQADPNHAAVVMELVACPVLVVPCTARYHKLENLVFATDFTDQEEHVLKQIIAFASQVGAHLTFVQVFDRSERQYLSSYKAAMTHLQQRWKDKNISFKLLEEEDVLEGISDFAELAAADMLIMATQDNYLLKRLFSSNYIKTRAYHTRFPILTFRQLKRKPCSGACANCKSRQQHQQATIAVQSLPY